MANSIKSYVKKLLKIIASMQKDYPKRKFTLDGRLVGDIGEILAEQIYDLQLLDGQQKDYDAISNGRMIQIKTTMKNSLTIGDLPEYYLGLRIDDNGNVEEIFNGPGRLVWDLVKHRKRPKSYLLSISISALRKLNATVSTKDKINKKNT
ncbi:MAG: hypothetical protein HRF52_11070 [Ignavibacterium sp.]|jgi:hypothetical protein|uniref:DUF6998 domain-containing protein n=1 Tax=Ignavibacterium sp. TaxID=2651167 RepID=UPI003296E903